MSGEEDEKEYELKDLIVQTLEANGVLPKIKAQIRANVFMALDQSDKKMNNSHSNIENVAAKKVLSVNEGRLSAALVRDFLEKTNLEYTLGVFDPELNPKTVLDDRHKLLSHFQISDKGADAPVLIDLIKKVNSSSSTERHDTNEISQSLIDAIKAKFDYFDLSRKGVIEQEKARELFKDLFPHFSKGVIDAFLSDEFTTSEIIKGVDYPKFLSVFKKWYSQCQMTHNTAEKEIKSNAAQQPKLNQTSKIDVHKDLFDDLSVKSNKEDLKKTNNVSNGLSSLGDLPPLTGVSNQNKKSLNTLNKDLEKRFKDTEDDNYDDDFTSGTTPRTPNQERKGSVKTPRGGPVSDEEIEENLSYVEESSKIDEITVDKSISTIQNNDADYIEDLSI